MASCFASLQRWHVVGQQPGPHTVALARETVTVIAKHSWKSWHETQPVVSTQIGIGGGCGGSGGSVLERYVGAFSQVLLAGRERGFNSWCEKGTVWMGSGLKELPTQRPVQFSDRSDPSNWSTTASKGSQYSSKFSRAQYHRPYGQRTWDTHHEEYDQALRHWILWNWAQLSYG